jgi:hypothetical protein
MMTDLPVVKICEGCEADFRRPTGTAKVSDERWAKRRFCSAHCGLQAAGSHSDHSNPGAAATYDPLRRNAEMGSAALLNRQRRFYIRIAAERGLNDEWEAAVQLGMAA